MFGETFIVEFVGGSRDGGAVESNSAPDYFEVGVGNDMTEIYERQNDEPPFFYVQIGYAEKEKWK